MHQKYDVLYSITTYSLMHTNEKNKFKVTLLLNNILCQIIIKFVH
jgi:hypothetical protein